MHTRSAVLMSVAILGGMLGCATIISGSDQEIKFQSHPDSAMVTIDGKALGKTPLIQKLSRKDKHDVRFELDGYAPVDMTLTRTVNGWVFGNIVFGGLIGVAIDGITGAMFALKPSDVQGELARSGTTTSVTQNGLYVVVVLHPEPGWQRIGTLEPVRK
jgi:hypothetical protein